MMYWMVRFFNKMTNKSERIAVKATTGEIACQGIEEWLKGNEIEYSSIDFVEQPMTAIFEVTPKYIVKRVGN